ncbi:MAG: ribose transport system substrate-binding protein [Halanaerobiales bacterium]|nr:ribose transport system substrate-binding protein [Halanaerobiales bacterium]
MSKNRVLTVSLMVMVLVLALSFASLAKDYVFGYAVQDLGNQYWVTVAEGVKDRAAELGNVEVIVLDARTDPARELANVEDLIQKKVDAILLSPWDPGPATSAVEAANRAGIPVLVLDVGVDGGKIETFIVSDNLEGGRIAGEYIAELIGGEGEVAHIQCQLGYKIPALRGEGFTQVMEEKGIKIVAKQPADSQRALGMTVMQNMLQAHPEIDAVFAENDEMALGAYEAIRAARLEDKIKVVGFDGTADALQSIKEGKLAGSVAQQPYEMGKMGVDAAIKFLNGEELPEVTYVPVKLITKENVDEYLK